MKNDRDNSPTYTIHDADDLFDNYNIINDIKYLILLHLNETDIHSIMSNVNTQWNIVCKSTFNDDRFKYKFIKYYQKLLNLGIDSETQSSSTLTAREILIECPWNRLWCKGTVVKTSSTALVVDVTFNIFNPFNKESLINDSKDMEKVQNTITYRAVIDEDSENNCEKDNPDLLSYKHTWFDDGYHHIAPLNTYDKYRTVRSSIHNNLLQAVDNYNNGNMNNEDVDCEQCLRSPCAPRDHFGRLLVDMLGFHCTKHQVLISTSEKIQSTTFVTYMTEGWMCGIIDLQALNLLFPKWKEGGFYQIPIIYEITNRLFDDTREPKDIEMNDNDNDNSNSNAVCFQNVFKYGKNRYYTRIWIHPNDTDFYQPFGTHTASNNVSNDLKCLLSTPALNKQNTNEYTAENYDFIKDSKLTVKEMFDDYMINIDNDKELAMFNTLNKDDEINNFFDHLKQNNKYCNKIIQLAGLTDIWIQAALLHYKYKHKTKYQFDQINEDCSYFENIDYTNIYPKQLAEKLNNGKLDDTLESLDCYRANTTNCRPIINFNLYTLVEQFKHFGELPYYTSERITLVNQLFKTDDFQKVFDDSPENQQWIKENRFYYQFVFVKPSVIKFIKLIDVTKGNPKYWDFDNWGCQTKEKYGNYELSMGRKDTYCIPLTKWKLGIFINWQQYPEKNEFVRFLYDTVGQVQLFLDITEEFNKFQECVKEDWLRAHKDSKTEKDWDDRRFFTNYNGILIDSKNKKMKKVFLQYFVHLDDKNQVKPLF